ncbi:MAG: class I SAM-dependent methyltransferase [Flavipsychrobacter sp.]
MALKQHTDNKVKYEQQVNNSREYVLPFIEVTHQINNSTRVFEIGCGEAGVLIPFLDKGCEVVGVDLDCPRIDVANDYLKKYVEEGRATFLCKNVYDEDFVAKYKGYFDIIILKDVIEHIPEQEKFVPHIKQFLREGGQIFFGFPPWYMPFGGHQQVCRNKIGMMPYYHILPKPIYMGILKMIGEDERIQRDLEEVYDTRITIERFERIIKRSGLQIKNRQHYLFNPIYKYKFGVNARKQSALISAIPFVRNFLTTCVYYTVG